MVRWIKYFKAFCRLIRLQNLAIIVLTMYMVRYFIVTSLLGDMGLSSSLTGFDFFLLVCATVCIAAGGYVINDYFDRKLDLINRPGQVVLGRIISRRAGMVWHMIFNIVGVCIGLFLSYKVHMLKTGIVFILISGLLWFYSTTYKRQVLIGNLVVSFMVAMVPLLILLFEFPLLSREYRHSFQSNPESFYTLSYWIIGYGVFAFIFTFIREIVKDIEDFEGDFAFASNTIPIVWGENVARAIVLIIALLTFLLLTVLLALKMGNLVTILYVGVTIILPLLIFCYLFYRSKSKKEYHRSSFLLKIIMISGVLFLPFAHFLHLHHI